MATSPFEKVTNNSGSGYCKMPDGTLICWGRKTMAVNAYSSWVSFPVPFIDTNYRISVQQLDFDTTGTGYTVIDSNIFGLSRAPATKEKQYDWIAIGRWK